ARKMSTTSTLRAGSAVVEPLASRRRYQSDMVKKSVIGMRYRWNPPAIAGDYALRAAESTSLACPGTRTLGQIRIMRPSGPMRNVLRMTPINLRPYIDFSPQASYFVSIFLDSSDPSAMPSRCLDLNLSCAVTGSADTPRMAVLAFAKSARRRENSIASFVQPGVSAFG